nr:gonadotropin-releasing hormone III - sea lamprey [Petromyzon marinus]AAB25536.1 gonadotropin-releasing hormone, GnRH-III [Petromyzon marinus=sea lampreys, brain, Peptide, 10 aa] [Petromyzon marinus]
EHWSHDWKPG